MYKPEASSISKQRRPNSLHHKCGLLSEWFIRGSSGEHTIFERPTLWKTWRSKHERSTRLDTDPEEMVSQQSGHNSTGRGGMPSSEKGNDRQHIGTSILVNAASRQWASTPRNDAHGHLHNDGGLHSPRFPHLPASKSKLNHMHTLTTRTADMNNLRWTKTSPHVRHTKHLTCSKSVQFFCLGPHRSLSRSARCPCS